MGDTKPTTRVPTGQTEPSPTASTVPARSTPETAESGKSPYAPDAKARSVGLTVAPAIRTRA